MIWASFVTIISSPLQEIRAMMIHLYFIALINFFCPGLDVCSKQMAKRERFPEMLLAPFFYT